MRQLESLIRLSEAMARLHADSVIRPSYVREVCRLLKASNINIIKNDLEFADNQEEMNRDQSERRREETAGSSNDLFVSLQVPLREGWAISCLFCGFPLLC